MKRISLKPLLLLCLLLFGIGNAKADLTKTETFENQTASQDYQNTYTYEAQYSNVGISWFVEHGCVSTTNFLTESKSMHMRAYYLKTDGTSKWNQTLPYTETKTPIKGLKSVSFNAAVSAPNGYLYIEAKYSDDGGNTWKQGNTSYIDNSSRQQLSFTISKSDPDKYYYIKISLKGSHETGKTSGEFNYIFRIDDVQFTYSGTTIPILTSEGYGTFYYPETFVMPDNLQGAVAEVENNNLRWNWMYNAGNAVPAGTPILVRRTDGEETSFVADVTANSGTAPSSNYLYANTGNTATEASAIAPSAAKYYALSYNTSGQNLGFYYRVADGASFSVPVGKVFLALPAGTEVKSFSDVSDENSIKGIEYNKTNAIYDIAGRRIGNVQRGIYIVNGRKLVR